MTYILKPDHIDRQCGELLEQIFPIFYEGTISSCLNPDKPIDINNLLLSLHSIYYHNQKAGKQLLIRHFFLEAHNINLAECIHELKIILKQNENYHQRKDLYD